MKLGPVLAFKNSTDMERAMMARCYDEKKEDFETDRYAVENGILYKKINSLLNNKMQILSD